MFASRKSLNIYAQILVISKQRKLCIICIRRGSGVSVENNREVGKKIWVVIAINPNLLVNMAKMIFLITLGSVWNFVLT